MIILADTAKMSLTDKGVMPDISLTNRKGLDLAVLHLTKGKQAIIAGNPFQGAGAGALAFSATVDAIKEKGDATTDWEFNFIQLIYQPIGKFHYAGFTKSDGSMVMDTTEPTPQYRLDSDAARAPFPVLTPATATMLPKIAAKPPKDVRDAPPDIRFGNDFEDHPNVSYLFLVNKNYLTGADNYLIRFQVHRYFFTAFVTKDKLNRRSSDFVPLASIAWRTIWEGSVGWMTKSQSATAMPTRREYKADGFQRTYPSAPYAKLIEKPTTNPNEMFSVINFTNVNNAFNTTANNRNCTASKDWPKDVSPIMWVM